MIRVTTFAGKTVAVFGLGASGNATALALHEGGATVAAWDDSEASRAAAGKAGVPLVDLRGADWTRFAALVLAPGVPLTHPEPHWTVKAASAAGVEVIGDIELFCRERRLQPFDVPFIAITGTNGKSTTTALVAHILRTAGLDVQMGGNIGTAVLSLDPLAEGRHYVLECSSFQIDLAPSIDPAVAVLLNITPDHLDRHGTIENYVAVKKRLLASAEISIVNVDDVWCRSISSALPGRKAGIFVIFSSKGRVDGWWAERDTLYMAKLESRIEVASLAGITTLRGNHNAQNALAAVAACTWLDVDWEYARLGLRTFPGLPHRMEEVGRIGRVLFINDSKATNADSAEKALLSWERGIFWIAGGRPKEGGIACLAPLFPRVAKAYLIGEAAEAFAATLARYGAPFERCGTLDVAVRRAAADAAASDAADPVVLLSPACASYDQFTNFEARGDAFRQLVAELPGFMPRARSEEAPPVVDASSAEELKTSSVGIPPLLTSPTRGEGPVESASTCYHQRNEDSRSPMLDAIPPPLWGRLGGGESPAAGVGNPPIPPLPTEREPTDSPTTEFTPSEVPRRTPNGEDPEDTP